MTTHLCVEGRPLRALRSERANRLETPWKLRFRSHTCPLISLTAILNLTKHAKRQRPAVLLIAACLCAAALDLNAQPPLPKGQMPELGRPTKVGDELPLFDFDAYFSGTWTFEWDMPEGALGESGQRHGHDRLQGGRAGKGLSGRHHRHRAGRRIHRPRDITLSEGGQDALAATSPTAAGSATRSPGRSAATSAASTTSCSTARRSPTTATASASSRRSARCRRSTTRSRPRSRSTAARTGTTAIPGGGKTRPPRNDRAQPLAPRRRRRDDEHGARHVLRHERVHAAAREGVRLDPRADVVGDDDRSGADCRAGTSSPASSRTAAGRGRWR